MLRNYTPENNNSCYCTNFLNTYLSFMFTCMLNIYCSKFTTKYMSINEWKTLENNSNCSNKKKLW